MSCQKLLNFQRDVGPKVNAILTGIKSTPSHTLLPQRLLLGVTALKVSEKRVMNLIKSETFPEMPVDYEPLLPDFVGEMQTQDCLFSYIVTWLNFTFGISRYTTGCQLLVPCSLWKSPLV